MNKALLVAAAVLGVLLAAVTILRRDRGVPSPVVGEGVVAERPLASMTRDELYELARERDIPGRSRMKKDELRDALGGA
jgi:hypothetical protein